MSIRGRAALSYLTGNIFATTPEALEQMIEIVRSGDTIEAFEPSSNELTMHGNIAVIDVNGPMVKRGGMFVNMCGATSYSKISEQIDKAEGADAIIFRVDTPGGDVAGADDLALKIRGLKQKTITLYEDLGASAGAWVFSATDRVYANRTAQLGSIGVVAAFRYKGDDGETIRVVSSNAENKVCDSKDACAAKLKSRVDEIESVFHERLNQFRGLSRDDIINGFNRGGLISAEKAKEIGFIDGIETFDSLLNKLKGEDMTPEQERLFGLLQSHESEDEKKELAEVLASYGLKIEMDGEAEEPEDVKASDDEDAEEKRDVMKIAAFLATVNVPSAKKAEWISAGLTFDEVAAEVAKIEQSEMEALDVTASSTTEAEALAAFAKQHKIKG